MLAIWLVLVVAFGSFAGKLGDVEENDPVSFLPGKAESVKALNAVRRFPSGEQTDAVIVYSRDGGLTPQDRAVIARDRLAINTDPPRGTSRVPPPILSRDGRAALLIAEIDTSGPTSDNTLTDATDALRDRVHDGVPAGLQVKVSGPAGFSTDAVSVFEQINGTLLLATATLVFLLLILIYRSPIFWAIPLFTVVFAEVIARGIGYWLAKAGVTINGQTSGILSVLVFGVGTDYALLLVARYREELRRHEDKHEAVAIALRRAGPAVLASGLTVIAALLCLSLAEVNGTAGLGPVAAIGVALAMIAMLTLLPALLAITGRRAFWPFVPQFGGSGTDETHGWWRRLGERIRVRPRRVWVATSVLLLVFCLGLTQMNSDLTSGNAFRDKVESVEGQELIAQSFPAGANAPTVVIVGTGGQANGTDPARVNAVMSALRAVPGVASVAPVERDSRIGVRLAVTLAADPYSETAFDAIPPLRAAAKTAGGPDVLIGGPTAEERDLRVSTARDNRVIVPLVLVVVFLILVLVLRAVLLPLLLMGTVILSYAAALGIGAFFFMQVFGFAGVDPGLPLFAFIFLVALGVDYNIFLMVRVREETHEHGTRTGMVRGLAVTGAVITSAGIVLAGTFSTLAVLPLVVLTEIGFTIAVGVLLDTFVVRSVLVPALVLDVGGRIWWPSSLARHTVPEQDEHDERDAATSPQLADRG
ncbi:MMPL family transporter [Conexibacter sp. CPCC 206217]|uniref:MMPL family transporter n=1 Tax=Conexibacter sp. CPCC 206217 TaxID=3064574 RepID=UPI0027281B5C|nr:MMPL family transporter [Conexibacter sp. CPCC 206217]MDO8213227.1 MMPL family transporter [Conexibacter sp. CPCC 206217]